MEEIKEVCKFVTFTMSLKSFAIPIPPFTLFLSEIFGLAIASKVKHAWTSDASTIEDIYDKWFCFVIDSLTFSAVVLKGTKITLSSESQYLYRALAMYYNLSRTELNNAYQIRELANVIRMYPPDKKMFVLQETTEIDTVAYIAKWSKEFLIRNDKKLEIVKKPEVCVRPPRAIGKPFNDHIDTCETPEPPTVARKSFSEPTECWNNNNDTNYWLLQKIDSLERKVMSEICNMKERRSAESEIINFAKQIEQNLHEEAMNNETTKAQNCLQYMEQFAT